MYQILALWRLFFFVIFTAIMFSLVLIARLLLFIAPAAWCRTRQRFFRFWAKGIGRLLGMKVAVLGPPPQSPFLLVANHLSYIDVVLLAHYVNAVFVAKAEVSSWPFLGPVVRSVNTIFIDRGNRRDLVRTNQAISEALRSGEGVVVFAEGTSSDGSTVLPLKSSMLQAAVATGEPVHCAYLSYATPVDSLAPSEAICWWDETPFFTHLLRLFRLPHFKALVHFSAVTVAAQDRKQLASELHGRIMALSTSTAQDTNAYH